MTSGRTALKDAATPPNKQLQQTRRGYGWPATEAVRARVIVGRLAAGLQC